MSWGKGLECLSAGLSDLETLCERLVFFLMAAGNLDRKEFHKNVYTGCLWEVELQVISVASLYVFYIPKIFYN